jgi:hypothetical protein
MYIAVPVASDEDIPPLVIMLPPPDDAGVVLLVIASEGANVAVWVRNNSPPM